MTELSTEVADDPQNRGKLKYDLIVFAGAERVRKLARNSSTASEVVVISPFCVTYKEENCQLFPRVTRDAMSVSIERLERSSHSSYMLQVGKAAIHIDDVNADLYGV